MGKDQLLVADVMTLDPIVIARDAPLEEADIMLRSTHIKGIPVVDALGVLVGVISHAHLASYRFDRQVQRYGSDPLEGHRD